MELFGFRAFHFFYIVTEKAAAEEFLQLPVQGLCQFRLTSSWELCIVS